LADADRMADFLISEQEAAARNDLSKLTLPSRILWWAIDVHTDDKVKVSLAKKASTSIALKSPQEESIRSK
jgi:hypothetical protein